MKVQDKNNIEAEATEVQEEDSSTREQDEAYQAGSVAHQLAEQIQGLPGENSILEEEKQESGETTTQQCVSPRNQETDHTPEYSSEPLLEDF